jgi:hypothetical protein
MSRAEILAAVTRGRAEFPRREAARIARAAEAARQRALELPGLIAAARTYLLGGALVAFVEEMESRGAVDAAMAVGDATLLRLVPPDVVPDVEVLIAAFAGIEGARARMLGTAIEIAWDRE